MDISINNYKDYSENYSSIKIEIIPVKDKYGKFINIFKDEDISHFHIYFNDCKEETKKTELTKSDKITKIKIIIDYQIKSFFSLFYNCTCIESINFLQFYRKNIINMNWMFFGCSSLEELDLSNFNTKNVTNMSYMFCECSSLKELNLSNFNTSNVTNMSYMFNKCSSLEELNLSNFNTNNVIDISYMFYGCISLKELNLSNFDTNRVRNKDSMFFGCSAKLNVIIDFSKNPNIKYELPNKW